MVQEHEQTYQAEQQRKFEKFQLKNLGGFEKLYPITQDQIDKIEEEKD